MELFLFFLTAIFSSMVLVALLIRWADTLGFVDIPNYRKVHTQIIPRVGGIGIVLGAALAILLWMDLTPMASSFLSAVGILGIFGVVDDRCDLDYRAKFFGQIVAVLIALSNSSALIKHVALLGINGLPDIVAYPLTFCFLLGTTNAMNLSDGLDGLAAGLAVLSLAFVAYIAALGGGSEIVAITMSLLGATLGFLRYNTHPAVVFMGDTGSQVLGFSAGFLALIATQTANSAVSTMLPLLILGLPIVDTLRVMVGRMARGVSPFKPDQTHFHHKLLAMGFDHYEAVLVIYVMQAAFILLALVLRYESDLLVLLVFLGIAGMLWLLFPVTESLGWRRPRLPEGETSPVSRNLSHVLEHRWLERAADLALSVAVPAFLLIATLVYLPSGTELGVFAVAMLAAWGFSRVGRLAGFPMMERLAMYSCVSLVFFLIGANGPEHPEMERFLRYGVFCLALIVGVGVGFSALHFRVTPSDFLVMFVLLAAASVPGIANLDLARLTAEAAVVLYALEFLLRRRSHSVIILRGVCFSIFGVIAVRTLLLG